MSEDTKRIVEIGGVKLEVDLRDAKVISNYKVGDRVRVLTKQYGDTFEDNPGVIIGFDEFEKNPSLRIAVLENNYSKAEIKFIVFNKGTKDVEICPCDDFGMLFGRSDILKKLDNEIYNAEEKVEDLKRKKAFFKSHFDQYFKQEEK